MGKWALQVDASSVYEFLEDGTLIFYSEDVEAGRGTYDWENGTISSDGFTVDIKVENDEMIMQGEDGEDDILLKVAE